MKEGVFERASEAASREAGKLEPWATAVFAVVAVNLVWETVGAPVFSALTSGGYYTLGQAASHALGNLIGALPAFALAWALWEARSCLVQLRDGQLWTGAVARLLSSIGAGALFASVAAILVVPTLRGWVSGARAFDLDVEIGSVAVAGLGLLLIFLHRVFAVMRDAAAELKAENDQFV